MAVRALFLDRDGVINEDSGYVSTKQDFNFIDGIFEACLFFKSKNFKIIVVTNQSGIARGLFSQNAFDDLTSWMLDVFIQNGCGIDGFYFCPHHPDFSGDCNCRKPKNGMIMKAEKDFNLDLTKSILIGDKHSDIQAAYSSNIGLTVQTGRPSVKYNVGEEGACLEVPTVKYFEEIFKSYSLSVLYGNCYLSD